MAKSNRVIELEEGIAQAVATMDESDATRIGLQEAFDSVRETLSETYGVGFEKAVSEFTEPAESSDDDEDETDDDETD